ncbi:MAG: hypothetical protein BWY85_01676 [Firmicutes bacterium ADurb.Bin506]|nr:MAG: hypothetical protein BWY85_01676 [Firmicutes bacterium ADurb.Bin506]
MMNITEAPYTTSRHRANARSSSGKAVSSIDPSTVPEMLPMPPKITMMVSSVDRVMLNIFGCRNPR